MVTWQSVKTGLALYLDNELLTKVNGWQKWVVGAGMTMYLDKGVNVFNYLKQQPIIQALEVVNANDEIDIDSLYNAFYAQAQKGAVTFKAPMIGDVTLKAEDVDKLYRYIKENSING